MTTPQQQANTTSMLLCLTIISFATLSKLYLYTSNGFLIIHKYIPMLFILCNYNESLLNICIALKSMINRQFLENTVLN